MEEIKKENMSENNANIAPNKNMAQIAGAIILAGVLVAGAVLLKGSASLPNGGIPVATNTLAPLNAEDRTLGNPNAKVAIVLYEDFQCPFCDKFFKESEKNIIDTYVKDGTVLFVYRDFAFLGPESVRAAEAARCAEDQGKFWQYHDYLFNHQNKENQGTFADNNLKSFAADMGLDTNKFNKCLDQNKYRQAVIVSKNEGAQAGVNGTPKGFILKDGKIVGTIDGAESYETVKSKLDSALK